jgi:hypothetical protein
MPITQNRFLSVITGAKRLIVLTRAIRETIRRSIVNDFTNANSVLARDDLVQAKDTIRILLARLENIQEMYIEAYDADMEELISIILAEELHFRKAAKKNARAKYYQEQARRDRGAVIRGPEAELDQPAILRRSSELAPRVNNFENTPEYRAFQDEMTRKYWPETITPALRDPPPPTQIQPIDTVATRTLSHRAKEHTETVEETIARERKENERTFGKTALSLDEAAEAELKLMRGASYEPDVLRTSAPTASELAQPPTSPDEPIV